MGMGDLEWEMGIEHPEEFYWKAIFFNMGIFPKTPLTTNMGEADGEKMGKIMGD